MRLMAIPTMEKSVLKSINTKGIIHYDYHSILLLGWEVSGTKELRETAFSVRIIEKKYLLIIFDYMIVEGTKEEVIYDKICIRLDFYQHKNLFDYIYNTILT